MEFVTDPLGWWVDPFVSNQFMRNALFAGVLAVLTTSSVGAWVVLRNMSFLGEALAHGVLPGIAIAFIAGGNTTAGALIAAIVMVLGVNLIRAHSPLPTDTSIGVLFVGFLALGVVIMSSQAGSYVGDLSRFLFGSITGIEMDDLLRQAVAAVVTVGGALIFYRAFLVLTFDETQAQLLGLRPRLTHLALLVLIAVAVVASFETVGSLLVVAFLIAPAATAAMLLRRVPFIISTAVGIGVLSVIVGLLVSFHYDTAAGATMALVAVLIFMLALAGQTIRRNLVRLRRGRLA